MVDRDIVIEKISNTHNCLQRIKNTTNDDADSLDDIDVQDIFVLNLQRAVQSAIDLGTHIVSSEGLSLPVRLKDIFSELLRSKIIDAQICKKMQAMVGFRNIAIHEYSKIDVDVLKKILLNHLPDLESFYGAILKHFDLV